MFDRLPTPFGLVRAGVAPDHPKIKNVIRRYEKTAGLEGFRFFGNVEIGRELTVADLDRRYHAVLYAYGTATDRQLGIPGEDLPGSHAATEFVNWYNAHPDFTDREFDLQVQAGGRDRQRQRRRRRRPDARPRRGRSSRSPTPPTTRSRRWPSRGSRRSSSSAAAARRRRRSPTPRSASSASSPTPTSSSTPAEMELDQASRDYVESEDCEPTHRRNVEIFTGFAQRPLEGKPKRVIMRFCCSPVEIQGDGRVESIVVGRNELVRDDSGAIRARDTGEREEIECGLVFRSIGYKGIGLEGIPFDSARGVIPNDAGRVHDPDSGEQVHGHYAVGWIKRGPSGVIGTNKKDAQDTVNSLLADLEAGKLPERPPVEPSVEDLLAERGADHVTYLGWQEIDAAEVAAGEPHGRPRIKFCSITEMIEASRAGDPA